MTERAKLRGELYELTRQVRALLEWYEACGTTALPGKTDGRDASRPKAPVGRGGTGPAPSARRGSARAPAPEAAAPEPPPASAPSSPPAARPAPPADAAARVARLAELDAEVQRCTACPLHEHRTHTVFARGTPEAALVFVGEGPGAREDARGVPFVGPAGELLDRMVVAMGLTPDDVYICNIVKCRPPHNRKPTPEEMKACSAFLQEQLALVEPEVLVALGATAAQGLLGWYDVGPRGPGITRLRGHWKLYAGRTPLMPTFHPAYLLRSPDQKRHVWADLQAVMERLHLSPVPSRRRS